jgi:predicted HTH transcriptional regulator
MELHCLKSSKNKGFFIFQISRNYKDGHMNKPEQLLNSIIEILKKESNKSELGYIELKRGTIDPKTLGENISGIANYCILNDIEKGYVVFGIEDETLNFTGVNFDPFNLKYTSNSDLEMWLRQMILGVDFKFIPFKIDNLNFLIVEVSKALGRLAVFDRKAYIRIGKNTTQLHRYPDIEKNWGQKSMVACFGNFQ